MVAKGGYKLINEKAIKTLRTKLIKKVYLITPNIPEAEVLTKTKEQLQKRVLVLESSIRNFGLAIGEDL